MLKLHSKPTTESQTAVDPGQNGNQSRYVGIRNDDYPFPFWRRQKQGRRRDW